MARQDKCTVEVTLNDGEEHDSLFQEMCERIYAVVHEAKYAVIRPVYIGRPVEKGR